MSIRIRRLNLLRRSQISWKVTFAGWIVVSVSSTLQTSWASIPNDSPEHETLRISKSLHPYSDDEWKQIAGEQITGKYDINRGDTLYDISKRLFGDARYWPKIWALNNGSIFNPHLILPGNYIAFMPGTGTSLPSVSIESNDGGGGAEAHAKPATVSDMDAGMPPLPKVPPRSQEWRMLPTQHWEASIIEAEQAAKYEIKVMGSLDKVNTLTPTRELSVFAASQPIPYLGTVVSAPTLTTYLKVGDEIMIQGFSEEIKPGTTYAVINEPAVLEKNEKKRQGLAYHIEGELQIIGIQNNLWVAVVKQGRGMMQRGSKIIPALPRLKNLDPVAAPATQEGQFYVDKGISTSVTGQHSFGFINLGSEDGLQEGMILESFQSRDLNTGKALPAPHLFRVAYMQVVQVSERFSTVQIISGATEVYDGLPVRLLTDLSKFQKFQATPSDQDDLPLPNPDEESEDSTTEEEVPPPNTLPAPEEAAPESDLPPPADDMPPPVVGTTPTAEPTAEATPQPTAEPSQVVGVPSQTPETAPAPQATSEAVSPPAPETPPADLLAPPAPASEPPPPQPETAPPPLAPPPSNELDALDGEDHLNDGEKRELQQLENHKASVPASDSASSSAPPSPETAPPPPPAPSGNDDMQVF
jgi:hypothetical protein